MGAGPLTEFDADAVARAMAATALGSFHAAQQAVRRMLPRGHGALLFIGVSAGVKGDARSAAVAMGKSALRGLRQSLARALRPRGLHVGHFAIDGGIRHPDRPARQAPPDRPYSMPDPHAIAESYWRFLEQRR